MTVYCYSYCVMIYTCMYWAMLGFHGLCGVRMFSSRFSEAQIRHPIREDGSVHECATSACESTWRVLMASVLAIALHPDRPPHDEEVHRAFIAVRDRLEREQGRWDRGPT